MSRNNNEDEDPDREDREAEISAFRTRIRRMRGEDPERDLEIDKFLDGTKGDISPASWRGHVRFFDALKTTPVKSARKGEKNDKGEKGDKKPKSGLFDWF